MILPRYESAWKHEVKKAKCYKVIITLKLPKRYFEPCRNLRIDLFVL